jgi:hypothetical protein
MWMKISRIMFQFLNITLNFKLLSRYKKIWVGRTSGHKENFNLDFV